jgi:hypothetical protein
VHNFSNVGPIQILKTESIVTDPNTFEVEIAIGNLKNFISPGYYQIPPELFQARGETLLSDIHKIINSA